MQLTKATGKVRSEVISLLQANNLPTGDLPLSLDEFFTVTDEGKVIGVIGMERFGRFGLLRSMVVHADYRNKHIAEALVTNLEEHAKASGITDMYLLTETADRYFSRKGYGTITREEVPAAVKASSEFSHVCPVSATVMKKHLEGL